MTTHSSERVLTQQTHEEIIEIDENGVPTRWGTRRGI